MKSYKQSYFFTISIVLLGLSVLGFSDNLFTNVKQESNSDPKFIVHGLFCFAWFIIFVIQTNYIRKENYNAHIKLGVAGMAAAIGVFITTMYVFVAIHKGWDAMSNIAKCNRIFMPTFALMVWLGYVNRRNREVHKRLIFVATLYMLGPILDRAMGHSFLDSMIPVSSPITWDATLFGIWSSFFISLFIYDWATLKKIHKISWLGFAWFCATLTISIFA